MRGAARGLRRVVKVGGGARGRLCGRNLVFAAHRQRRDVVVAATARVPSSDCGVEAAACRCELAVGVAGEPSDSCRASASSWSGKQASHCKRLAFSNLSVRQKQKPLLEHNRNARQHG